MARVSDQWPVNITVEKAPEKHDGWAIDYRYVVDGKEQGGGSTGRDTRKAAMALAEEMKAVHPQSTLTVKEPGKPWTHWGS